MREITAKEGLNPSDEQLRSVEQEALHQLGLNILKDSLLHSSRQVARNLPQAVAMVFAKVNQASTIAGANHLRDVLRLPEQKLNPAQIKEALFGREWEHLKTIIGIPSQGGARNVKHTWTDEERACLADNYERLQPIWAEAKRIAKSAQKSKESTRSHRWREEVKRAYPELPDDLVERLSSPRSADAKPSDIALTHSASLCIPVNYSLRRLREELKKARQFKSTS